jgi:hypothetical protein
VSRAAKADEKKELQNEELIANIDEIKDYDYLTRCMIC